MYSTQRFEGDLYGDIWLFERVCRKARRACKKQPPKQKTKQQTKTENDNNK